MHVRLSLLAVALTVLGSPSAMASLVAVTSYDIYNGDGTGQYGSHDYYDSTYAGQNATGNPLAAGTSNPIPTNGNETNYLTGGTGLLTDGSIPTTNYSQSFSQYVGWKYQSPTITFFLTPNQTVSTIALFVASSASSGGGLVGQPSDVILSVNGTSIDTSFSFAAYPGSNNNTEAITLSGFGNLSSGTNIAPVSFALNLVPATLQGDGTAYYNQHVAPFIANNYSACVTYCDPTYGPYSSGFYAHAYQTNTEPWILLSQVQFSSAVPEPSTWVMMIAGLAGMGFLARHRKSKVGAADGWLARTTSSSPVSRSFPLGHRG